MFSFLTCSTISLIIAAIDMIVWRIDDTFFQGSISIQNLVKASFTAIEECDVYSIDMSVLIIIIAIIVLCKIFFTVYIHHILM